MIHKLYEFYKLLHHDATRFPKNEKYELGGATKTRVLLLIEGIWEANMLPTPERLLILERLQRILDLLKIFVRLAHDLGIYSLEGYVYRQTKLQEIGRMLGVWRKNTRTKIGLDP